MKREQAVSIQEAFNGYCNGFKIETRKKGTEDVWYVCDEPQWNDDQEYRVMDVANLKFPELIN